MRVWVRSLMAATAGLALVGLSGCAGGGAAQEPQESSAAARPGAGLQNFDTCGVMTPESLAVGSYSPEGKPVKQFDVEPGCEFLGEKVLLTVYKNQEETLDSYSKKSNWVEVANVDVNGRPAAKALNRNGAEDGGVCTTMLSAGGGVIVLDGLSNDTRTPYDVCGELLKVAQMIEPNLPE